MTENMVTNVTNDEKAALDAMLSRAVDEYSFDLEQESESMEQDKLILRAGQLRMAAAFADSIGLTLLAENAISTAEPPA